MKVGIGTTQCFGRWKKMKSGQDNLNSRNGPLWKVNVGIATIMTLWDWHISNGTKLCLLQHDRLRRSAFASCYLKQVDTCANRSFQLLCLELDTTSGIQVLSALIQTKLSALVPNDVCGASHLRHQENDRPAWWDRRNCDQAQRSSRQHELTFRIVIKTC